MYEDSPRSAGFNEADPEPADCAGTLDTGIIVFWADSLGLSGIVSVSLTCTATPLLVRALAASLDFNNSNLLSLGAMVLVLTFEFVQVLDSATPLRVSIWGVLDNISLSFFRVLSICFEFRTSLIKLFVVEL
jgi:hypothetical protein